MKPSVLPPVPVSPREAVPSVAAEKALASGESFTSICRVYLLGEDERERELSHLLLERCSRVSSLGRKFQATSIGDIAEVTGWVGEYVCLLWADTEGEALEILARAQALPTMPPILVVLDAEDTEDTESSARRILNVGASDCLREDDLSASLLERSIRFALQNGIGEAKLRHLNESNARLGAALEDTSTAMLMCGTLESGCPIWWVNSAFERLTGYSAEEVQGRPPYFLEGKDSQQISSDVLKTALQNGAECDTTLMHFRRDGSAFWNEVHISPIREGAQKEISGWIWHLTDVTERVLHERHLEESRRDLEVAQRLTHLGSWWVVLNAEADVWRAPCFWSSELYRIAGLPQQNVSPSLKTWKALLHPRDRLRVLRSLVALSQPDGPELVRLEHRLSLPDGSEKWVQSTAELERDEKGTPTRVVGTILDITERVQNTERVRESEQRTRAVIQNAPLVLWQLDEQGIITWIQGRALTSMGRQPAELENRSIFEVLNEVPGLQDLTRRALAGEECEHSTWFRERFFVVRYTPLPEGGALGVGVDMSETEAVRQQWRESERRYASMVANVPGVVYRFVREVDGTLGFDFISARAREVWGEDFNWSKGELAPHIERIHPQDTASLLSSIEESARDMAPWAWSGRLLDSHGDWMWVRGSATPWKRDDGAIVWDGLIIDESATHQWKTDLERSQRALEETQELAGIGSFSWDVASGRVQWSDRMFRIYGYEPQSFVPQVELAYSHVHPDDQECVASLIRDPIDSNGNSTRSRGKSFNFRIRRADGQERFLQAHSHVEFDEDGEPRQLIGSVQDLTEQHVAERALRDSEERYALAALGANDGLWDWNLSTNTIYLSVRWREMIGCPLCIEEGDPAQWFSRVHPDDLVGLEALLQTHLNGQSEHFECEYRLRHEDGNWRWMLGRGLAVRDSNGEATRIAGSQTDISNRKHFESQLARSAFYDALTGLPNRELFLDRLEWAIARAARDEDHSFAVLFLDLDRFKNINDSLGHLAGDALLIEAGRRFEACLRPGDTVARLGGDEFAILLEGLADAAAIELIATRIGRELEKPFGVEGRDVFITVSIGVAPAQGGQSRAVDLLRNADTAMYRAKGLGRARHATFDNSMHQSAIRLLELESDLWRALEREELRLHFQPIVELRTGQISGFEALVRWEHPTRGLVSPGEFIPLAEETGLIVPIGWWVLEEACRQASAWSDTFTMAVNLSSKQFSQADCIKRVQSALKKTGFDARRLKLEITETVIMQNTESASTMLRTLKEMGVALSMDDFGTGYSSLSYLHRFPLDVLKIDRSFIAQMGVQTQSDPVVNTILDLARSLNMQVVAEGVESEEQVRLLRDMDCGFAQGYFFARPLPGPQITELIKQNPRW